MASALNKLQRLIRHETKMLTGFKIWDTNREKWWYNKMSCTQEMMRLIFFFFFFVNGISTHAGYLIINHRSRMTIVVLGEYRGLYFSQKYLVKIF